MRRLLATVLVFEAIVIGLAIPVAITIGHDSPRAAGTAGGALALVAIVLAGVAGRPRARWALVAGTVLQAVVIAAGVVVPAMYALGAIFALLWLTAVRLGRRYEHEPEDAMPADGTPPDGTAASHDAGTREGR